MSDTDNTAKSNGADDPNTTHVDAATMEAMAPPADPIDDRGRRLQTFLSCSDFASQERALAAVVGKPRGTSIVVGSFAGYASGIERRPSGLKVKAGEKPPEDSIWIAGEFESVSAETGEVRAAAWLILPKAAGQLLERAFQAGATRALLDLDVELTATGRSIPYEWAIRARGSDRRSEAQQVVDQIRARQRARLASQAQPQLSLASGGAKPEGAS